MTAGQVDVTMCSSCGLYGDRPGHQPHLPGCGNAPASPEVLLT